MSPIPISTLLFVWVFHSLAIGQVVEGIVVDETTGEPIPYVHIGVSKQNLGVISHLEGDFRIEVQSLNARAEVVFSYIGYESKSFSLNTLLT